MNLLSRKNSVGAVRKPPLWFLAAFSAFLFAACGPKAPPRVAVPDSERSGVLREIQTYLQGLESLQSLRGFARVRLKVKGGSQNFDEAVIIRFPESFRFETLDDLGNTRLLLSSDGRTLFWQDFSRREYFEGALHEVKLGRLLPMASTLSETLALFIGKPTLEKRLIGPVEREGEGPRYRVILPLGELVWDSGEKAILSFASKKENGKVAYRYEGESFLERPLAGDPQKRTIKIPSRVRLKDFKSKNEIRIRYQQLELNPKIQEGVFVIQPSLDAKRLDEID